MYSISKQSQCDSEQERCAPSKTTPKVTCQVHEALRLDKLCYCRGNTMFPSQLHWMLSSLSVSKVLYIYRYYALKSNDTKFPFESNYVGLAIFCEGFMSLINMKMFDIRICALGGRVDAAAEVTCVLLQRTWVRFLALTWWFRAVSCSHHVIYIHTCRQNTQTYKIMK